MDRIYHPTDGCSLRIRDVDTRWFAVVQADVHIVCGNKVRHDLHIAIERAVGSREEEPMLTAFEWAIRGNEDAAAKVARLVIDEEIDATFLDPCIIPEPAS